MTEALLIQKRAEPPPSDAPLKQVFFYGDGVLNTVTAPANHEWKHFAAKHHAELIACSNSVFNRNIKLAPPFRAAGLADFFNALLRNEPHKNICCIITTLPEQNGEETFDFVLAAATFAAKVTLIFKDAGVLQLKAGQSNYTKGYGALKLYDVSDIYVTEESLKENNLTVDDLLLTPIILTEKSALHLSQQQEIVFTF